MVSRAENVFKQGLPLNRIGERNIPKKYLKAALYTTEGETQGYYVYYKGSFIPIEFDFTHCFWYIVKYDNKSEAQPESIDIKIPTQEEEKSEGQLEKLAEYIPTLSRPRSHTATSRLPPITTIMATQTTTEPTQTFALEEGLSSICKGGGPPGDTPNLAWFGGSGFPYHTPNRSRGGGRDDGGGGRGSGGPPGAAAGRNPEDLSNNTKLSGKELVIFKGDRSKAEALLLEWAISMMLNLDQDIMKQPFSRTMLFLTFIKGPTSKNG